MCHSKTLGDGNILFHFHNQPEKYTQIILKYLCNRSLLNIVFSVLELSHPYSSLAVQSFKDLGPLCDRSPFFSLGMSLHNPSGVHCWIRYNVYELSYAFLSVARATLSHGT
jgi:hypothetical protein